MYRGRLRDEPGQAARLGEEALKTAREVVKPSPEPSTTLVEFARRGGENFIHAQKALLDVALKPFTPPPAHSATHTPHHARPAARRARHA